ncbi:hypothetical protein SEA_RAYTHEFIREFLY_31 [Gordonia phage RayTheFireFly]|nr:hypothetical protein SEA_RAYTHEFIREFLY_31 [Gordonia phage RayTheFireFly]
MSYRLQNDVPDEIYVELGKLAASAGQIEFHLFGMVHDLLQSPVPGISITNAVARDLSFNQTANLVQRLLEATFDAKGVEVRRFKAWRKEADKFMERRNSLLHATWMSTGDDPPVPVQRKNMKVQLDFDLDDLRGANDRARTVLDRAFVVAAEIQGKLRSAKLSQPPA